MQDSKSMNQQTALFLDGNPHFAAPVFGRDHLDFSQSLDAQYAQTTESSSKHRSSKGPVIHMEWEDELLRRPMVFEITDYENTMNKKHTVSIPESITF